MPAALHDVGEAIVRITERFDAFVRRADESRTQRAARSERIPANVERALGLVDGFVDQLVRDLRFLAREYQSLNSSSRDGRAAAKKIEKVFAKIDTLTNTARTDAFGISSSQGARDRLSAQAELILDAIGGTINQLARAVRTLVNARPDFDRATEFGKAARARIDDKLERVMALSGKYSGFY